MFCGLWSDLSDLSDLLDLLDLSDVLVDYCLLTIDLTEGSLKLKINKGL